ncbi:MAG TPA: glycosyltransferase, partial [Acetobacteraceae bacterium]|nr:glycosyltransferase [Acetobacteraceae bacterium]
LQEAGSILWQDGTSLGYLRDASPLAPEANFVREVDFCSGAFLLVRTDLLLRLDGFSDEFTPAYYEDADLCVRARQAGFKVVYDPGVVIHHYEYGSASSYHAVEALSARAREVFVRRNDRHLRSRYARDRRAEIFARSADVARRRILLIEDQVPLRMLGSGFVRSNDLIRTMASLGLHVTVFPMQLGSFDPASVYADMPETVEVMYDRSFNDLARFLEERDGYYDTIWIVRTHNLDRVRPVLEPFVRRDRPPQIVLDAEAIATIRESLRSPFSSGDNRRVRDEDIVLELRNATFCQRIVAVSEGEAAEIRRLVSRDVSVIGHVREVALTQRSFEQRSGMLFLGAIHDETSPNLDSIRWFIDEVLPLIEDVLGSETRLTVVGFMSEEVSLDGFRDHSRVTLLGPVADTRPLYDSHRLFIAPARYAAGIPYKVHEAASVGLPVVATELLKNQLGWVNGEDLLSAEASEPSLFAAAVVRLYNDPLLWAKIRSGAARRISDECTNELFAHAVTALLC